MIPKDLAELEAGISEQRIFWDYEEHLGTILAKGTIRWGSWRARWISRGSVRPSRRPPPPPGMTASGFAKTMGRAKPPPDGLMSA